MKEKYNWDYNIKIKTREGGYEYEKETLDRVREKSKKVLVKTKKRRY